MLRAPSDTQAAQAPTRVAPWLSWDAQLVVGFIDGFARASGKGFTPEARAKIERDFKDPRRVLAIYLGLQHGVVEGAFDDLWDNLEGVVQIAGWLAMNLPVAGFSLQDLKDRYESLTDPVGKAARDKETQERHEAIFQGLAQFAVMFENDPGIMADLGEEFGQAAGDHVAHLYAVTFANAEPSEKGRMIGHALGYLAMEIALLFIGPETLIAKAPAAAAKLARAGGTAVEAILRLMDKVPALRKLLAATGRLGKAAKTVSPEAKLLAHLEQAIVDKVLQQGLRFEDIEQLAKLEKAAAEKLLRELSAKEVLELEQQLGKAKLEELAKTQNAKEIQAAAKVAASERAAAEKLAAENAAAENATKEHVHQGGIEQSAQSPYYGKWDGGGVHDWNELEAICKRDGYRIKNVTEDPVTGVRRVEVERLGIHPNTKATVTGTVKKTIYPKDLTPGQIDQAGDLALKAAVDQQPGTKLDPFGTNLKADGSPADGFFEATVKLGDPPRDVKIQGWFKETSDGTKVISSHAPAYNKAWPAVDPKGY